jgi:hypothetical protein
MSSNNKLCMALWILDVFGCLISCAMISDFTAFYKTTETGKAKVKVKVAIIKIKNIVKF